jgi:hypothetical protein
MDKYRSFPRLDVSRLAVISAADATLSISCIVRNLSEGGACLEMATTVGIPPKFSLTLESTSRPCRVIWRTATKLGVSFKPEGRFAPRGNLHVEHLK